MLCPDVFYVEEEDKLAAAAAKSFQSCPTLCDPIDGSPPGSSVHGIFQARVQKWGAIAFSEFKDSWKQTHLQMALYTYIYHDISVTI